MIDKELLELAAKAAEIERLDFGKGEIKTYCRDGYTTTWNPLEDDGDALRLAVKLKMLIDIHTRIKEIDVVHEDAEITLGYSDDAGEATRRAIVCVAAELGEAMP